MTLIKTRVPNFEAKHIVTDFIEKEKTLYADLTLLRDRSYPDNIPVYIANDISDMVLYDHRSRYELNELGLY